MAEFLKVAKADKTLAAGPTGSKSTAAARPCSILTATSPARGPCTHKGGPCLYARIAVTCAWHGVKFTADAVSRTCNGRCLAHAKPDR